MRLYFRLVFVIVSFLFFLPGSILSQGYICAVGGGSEEYESWSDEPYSWFVEKADSGKILVLSYASATEWIPDYLKSLGAKQASNLLIDSREKAESDEIYNLLKTADGVFIKGGDQFKYVSLWKGTRTELAIKELYSEGKVIAGTSAGAMVLSEIVFTAKRASVDPHLALIDPFNAPIDLDDQFLNLLPGFIIDTHFIQRGRVGRLIPFMLKYFKETGRLISGLGIDDATAICINPDFTARVFGSGAVSVLYMDDNTEFNVSDSGYVVSSLRCDKLLRNWFYDLKDFKVLSYSGNEKPFKHASEITNKINSLIFITGTDDIDENFQVHIPEFILKNNCLKPGFITDSSVQSELADKIKQANLDAFILPIDEQTIQNKEFADSLNSCDSYIFSSYNLLSLSLLADSNSVIASALKSILKEAKPFMFLGETAKLLSSDLCYNNYAGSDASFKGNLIFYNGMSVLNNLIIQPSAFLYNDYYENNISSLEYTMMLSGAAFGVLLDDKDLITLNPVSAELQSEGISPIIIIDASNVSYTDASTFSENKNGKYRQVAGFDNLRYFVTNRKIKLDLKNNIITRIDLPTVNIKHDEQDLLKNYPNPFNPTTTIEYSIPVLENATFMDPVNVSLKIYNMLGEEVKVMVDREQKPGTYVVKFDGTALANGVYFCRIMAGNITSVRKMVLIK